MTLEATLVFPWVLILTLALILFMLTETDRALHYYTASVASERAAFAWPHSAANIRTGGYPPGAYDGLYWRLKDDALLAGLFGWSVQEGGGPIVHIGRGDAGDSSLAANKLRKSAVAMPDGINGTIAYHNRIWLREVRVAANGSETSGVLRRLFPSLSPAASASVSGAVSEPAEWLRTFHVVRYYYARIKQEGSQSDSYREQAAAVLEQRR